jgi:hypothetical protein
LRLAKVKSYQDPISTNNLGMIVHPYNFSYMEGIGRRITVLGQPRQKGKTPSEKQTM